MDVVHCVSLMASFLDGGFTIVGSISPSIPEVISSSAGNGTKTATLIPGGHGHKKSAKARVRMRSPSHDRVMDEATFKRSAEIRLDPHALWAEDDSDYTMAGTHMEKDVNTTSADGSLSPGHQRSRDSKPAKDNSANWNRS